MSTFDVRRLALAAGVWLAVVYALCVAGDLLFPREAAMYRIWGPLLLGFDWAHPWTLLLGLVEAFLYGAVGAASFAWLYNVLRPAASAR